MSQYIGVRAFNRSQGVRIGGQVVRSTVKNTGALAPITYIDLEDKAARKQLAYHSAIGAVYTCTGVQTHPYAAGVVQTDNTNGGLKVTEGASDSDMVLGIAAGVVRADTGDSYTKTASTVTITTAPGAGNKRVDLVSFKISDQTYVVTAGTVVANSATAVAPSVPAGQIPLATVAVASSVTAIVNADITDARVFA